jgi:hypothetical protein
MNRKRKSKEQVIRIGMIEKGTNLRLWAQAMGYPESTVYAAARGARAGIKSVKIQKELTEYVAGNSNQ